MAKSRGIGKVLAKRGAKAILGEVPGASFVMEGVGAVQDIRKAKKSRSEGMPEKQFIKYDSLDKPNKGERYVILALYGK